MEIPLFIKSYKTSNEKERGTLVIKTRFTRFLAAVLAISLLVVPGSAFATNADNADRAFSTYDVITENSLLRGTNVPTAQGTLPYTGAFSNVQAGVYTNYYFTGVNSLIVEFWSTTPSNATFTVQILNVDGGYWVGADSGVSTYKKCSNLSATEKYAVFFRPDKGYSPAAGSIGVYNGIKQTQQRGIWSLICQRARGSTIRPNANLTITLEFKWNKT